MNVAYATMPFHSLTSQTSSTAFRIHQAKVQKTEGKVISVGPGNTHPESGKISPMPVNEGDGVVYGMREGGRCDADEIVVIYCLGMDLLGLGLGEAAGE